MKRHRGLAVALVLAGVALAFWRLVFADVRYDRFHLPAFDGHVYAVMAEEPRFFTVAPWGYRVLTPWLAAAFSGRDVTVGFFWLTHASLVAAGGVFFLVLRRLGHSEWISWGAVLVFVLSPAVGAVVRYQVLVEPLTVLLEVAFLAAIAGSSRVPALAFLMLAGALSKEFALAWAPLVALAPGRRRGLGARLLDMTLVTAPAALAVLALRAVWTPQLAGMPVLGQAPSMEQLAQVGRALGQSAGALAWLLAVALLAFLGLVRARDRDGLWGSAYLAAGALVAPLLNPFHFSAADALRLVVYAVPPAVALAARAVEPNAVRPAPLLRPASTIRTGLLVAATAMGVVLPLLYVSRYRRLDLRGERSAAVVWATTRGSLAVARDLERRLLVTFDFEPRPLRHDLPPLLQAGRSRWVLRDGWGPDVRSGTAEALLTGPAGTILVPCLRPQALEVSLDLSGPPGAVLAASLDGRPLGNRVLGEGRTRWELLLPAAGLAHGDNLLILSTLGGVPPRPVLHAVEFRPRT